MNADADLSLEMVDRLRGYEPFIWYRTKVNENLTSMAVSCLDESVSKEVREERFHQYIGGQRVSLILDNLETGLRNGIAQRNKNVK